MWLDTLPKCRFRGWGSHSCLEKKQGKNVVNSGTFRVPRKSEQSGHPCVGSRRVDDPRELSTPRIQVLDCCPNRPVQLKYKLIENKIKSHASLKIHTYIIKQFIHRLYVSHFQYAITIENHKFCVCQ